MDIDNSKDIIDSRAVIERITELEAELEEAHRLEFADSEDGDPITAPDLETWIELIAEADAEWHTYTQEARDLKSLRNLAEEGAAATPDWTYGAGLIRESYFEEYARETAQDIGAINSDAGWPCDCIDWARAAEQLKMDYASVDFDGVTYYVR